MVHVQSGSISMSIYLSIYTYKYIYIYVRLPLSVGLISSLLWFALLSLFLSTRTRAIESGWSLVEKLVQEFDWHLMDHSVEESEDPQAADEEVSFECGCLLLLGACCFWVLVASTVSGNRCLNSIQQERMLLHQGGRICVLIQFKKRVHVAS